MNHTNTLIPHKHAALIKEWAEHVASGAVDAGWFYCKSSSGSGNCPWWDNGQDYCIIMTDRHPDYMPPHRKILIEVELTDAERESILSNFDGIDGTWFGRARYTNLLKFNTAIYKAIKEAK